MDRSNIYSDQDQSSWGEAVEPSRQLPTQEVDTGQARHFWLTSPDAVLVFDSSLVIRSANPSVHRLTGWPVEEIVEQSLELLCPPELQEEYRLHGQTLRNLTREPEARQATEALLQHRSGSQLPVEITLSRYEEEGETMYTAVLHDISKRTQAFADLHFKSTLLEAQSEAAFDGILIVSPNGQILSWNHRFRAMWSMPDDILAEGEDRAAIQAVLQSLVDPQGFLAKIEHLRLHPEESGFDELALLDGRVFERYTAPVVDAKGVNHGRVYFFRDITILRSAERQAEAAHQKLLEASRHTGMAEVACNVLHNVGNVLTSVNVAAEQIAEILQRPNIDHLQKIAGLLEVHKGDVASFLERDAQGQRIPEFVGLLAQSLAEDRERVLEEVSQLRRSIEHIRQVIAEQQSSARRGTVLETVDLAEVVEDALRINAAGLKRHGVRVRQEMSKVPSVRINKHQVLQILVNLIRNAKDAMEGTLSGIKQLTIALRKADADYIEVAVSDTGVGIPSENLACLFDHGFTTRAEGHGFGLHSAALLARELGGSIEASSEGWGCGSIFFLRLPFQPPT